MDATLATTQERIDDIPLIIEVAKRLGLPEMLEGALGTHGHQRGLENGWLATLWIAYILSENDHRKSAVQDWSLKRRETLSHLCGQPIRDVELNDDRLGNLLRHMSDVKVWEMIETQLWRGTVLAYDLKIEGVRLDSTTSYGYHTVGEDGLMQLGHSKDHRPDLPQLKLMAAAAEPMGQLMACDVHPGHRADDGLYVPLIRRVRQMVGRSGILYLGDAKMAAQATRADIAAANDYYVVPMPRTGVAGAKLDGWLDAIAAAEHQLQPIMTEHGLYGVGVEWTRQLNAKVRGRAIDWEERMVFARSERLADQQERALTKRLEQAHRELLALSPEPGRGRRQHRTIRSLLAAADRVLAKRRVAGLLDIVWRDEADPARGQPDRERYLISRVIDNEAAIQAARNRLGWRVFLTNLPVGRATMPQVVQAYNRGWIIEQRFHNLKDRPLGIQPLFVTTDEQITGLTYLLTLALRVLTLIEYLVRRACQASGQALSGLYEGQPSRQTDTPTGRRLLRAFSRAEISLLHIRTGPHSLWQVTPLIPVLVTILRFLGLDESVYTNLELHRA